MTKAINNVSPAKYDCVSQDCCLVFIILYTETMCDFLNNREPERINGLRKISYSNKVITFSRNMKKVYRMLTFGVDSKYLCSFQNLFSP